MYVYVKYQLIISLWGIFAVAPGCHPQLAVAVDCNEDLQVSAAQVISDVVTDSQGAGL